jgi:hypothetical protein
MWWIRRANRRSVEKTSAEKGYGKGDTLADYGAVRRGIVRGLAGGHSLLSCRQRDHKTL